MKICQHKILILVLMKLKTEGLNFYLSLDAMLIHFDCIFLHVHTQHIKDAAEHNLQNW